MSANTVTITENNNTVTIDGGATIVVSEPAVSIATVGTQGPAGATGPTGPAGANGQGVPVGGAAGQVLSKIDATDYNTEWSDPSGAPAGSDTQVQYNDSGAFAGSSSFTWDETNKIATFGGPSGAVRRIEFDGPGLASNFYEWNNTLLATFAADGTGARFTVPTATTFKVGSSDNELMVKGGTGVSIATSAFNRSVDRLFTIGVPATADANATSQLYSVLASKKALVLQGAASQTANLTEWQDSSGTIGARVTSAQEFSNPGATSSEQFGAGASATGGSSVAIGSGATVAGSNSVGIGQNVSILVTASSAVVIGKGASGVGSNVIIGSSATGSGASAVAIGPSASAGTSGVAIGNAAATNASAAVVIGRAASGTASTTDVVVIGDGATSNSGFSVAVGQGATVGAWGTAIGEASNVTGSQGTALGQGTAVSHTASIALGRLATSSAANQLMIGASAVKINEIVVAGTDTLFKLESATLSFVVKAAASHTANLTEWQNSSGTALSYIRSDGSLKPASMADSAAANDSIYYSTDASKLVYKDSGGTVNNLY